MKPRRLRTAVGATAVIFALSIGGGILLRHVARARCGDIAAGPVARPGAVVALRCAPIVISNVDGRPVAFVALSPTGSGAPLTYNRLQRTFGSPHGETYNLLGQPISGPTGSSTMHRCPVTATRSRLRVTLPAKPVGPILLAACKGP